MITPSIPIASWNRRCLLARLLAERGIDHEPAVGGLRDRVEVDDLLDQVGLQRVAALGINDDDLLVFDGNEALFYDFRASVAFGSPMQGTLIFAQRVTSWS